MAVEEEAPEEGVGMAVAFPLLLEVEAEAAVVAVWATVWVLV